MKIIRVTFENRQYNGIPFKYYSLYTIEQGNRLVYGASGSTLVFDVDKKTNEPISGRKPKRLDEIPTLANAEILVWKNEAGRVIQIDRLVTLTDEERSALADAHSTDDMPF